MTMSANDRVLSALEFKVSDRVPVYDSYWPEFEDNWKAERRPPPSTDIRDYYAIDLEYIYPDETPFPSAAGVLESTAAYEISRSGWGSLYRVNSGAKFYHELEVALPEKSDLGKLVFEAPRLDSRYPSDAEVEDLKSRFCLFAKTGGPYMRTATLRGTTQWLMDLAEDPSFAYELAMRMTRHITAVGLEAIRRFDLYETGIWFFDDMGANNRPMFSPRTFERSFLPCYEWMCAQYRAAGVKHILLHCDGNIDAILEPLVDAGIQGLHPVEPKAGMDAVKLRRQYGQRLALIGALDNAHVLPGGDKARIAQHVRSILELHEDGGLVIGSHSIGPDVSIDTYEYVQQLIRQSM